MPELLLHCTERRHRRPLTALLGHNVPKLLTTAEGLLLSSKLFPVHCFKPRVFLCREAYVMVPRWRKGLVGIFHRNSPFPRKTSIVTHY